jgi:hypothetical protein
MAAALLVAATRAAWRKPAPGHEVPVSRAASAWGSMLVGYAADASRLLGSWGDPDLISAERVLGETPTCRSVSEPDCVDVASRFTLIPADGSDIYLCFCEVGVCKVLSGSHGSEPEEFCGRGGIWLA